MALIIQIRRDTATKWSTVNPVLAECELGIETDTGKAKLGNGTDDWTTLEYYNWGIEAPVQDIKVDGVSILDDAEADLTSTNMASVVRGVSPACTTITASDTTATLTANQTYAHAVSSSGCVYTLTTPSSTDVYSGFILMIDTANSASIAFQTDDTPAVSIVLNGNPTVETGKYYTVTGQYNTTRSSWDLFIIDYSAS